MNTMRRFMLLVEEITAPQKVVLYHASPDEIRTFRPLTHFGSRKAALAVASFKRRCRFLYQVEITLHAAVLVQDLEKEARSHTWQTIADMTFHRLLRKNALSAETRASFDAVTTDDQFAGWLIALGYDALVYKNLYEDRGSTSVINVTDSQVQILGVETEPFKKRAAISGKVYVPDAHDSGLED